MRGGACMAIGKEIGQLISDRGFALKDFSKKAGISYNTLYAIIKRDNETVKPEILQKIAGYLPHGLARQCVSGLMTGSESDTNVALMLGYSTLFVAVSVIVRNLRVTSSRG